VDIIETELESLRLTVDRLRAEVERLRAALRNIEAQTSNSTLKGYARAALSQPAATGEGA
jgi:hypothetical protein